MKRLISVALFLIPTAAPAALVSFNFSGTLDAIDPAIASAFTTGMSYTGSVTWDTSVPDSNASVDHGDYSNAITAFSVTVGPGTYSWDPLGPFGFINGVSVRSIVPESYEFHVGAVGPGIGPWIPLQFSLAFANHPLVPPELTNDAIATDAIPTVAPDPADFNQNVLILGFWQPGPMHALASGPITQVSAVSAPGTVLLLSLGLLLVRRRVSQSS